MCAHCETLAIPVYLKLLLYIKIEWTLALAASRHVWEAACKFTNLRERAALFLKRAFLHNRKQVSTAFLCGEFVEKFSGIV